MVISECSRKLANGTFVNLRHITLLPEAREWCVRESPTLDAANLRYVTLGNNVNKMTSRLISLDYLTATLRVLYGRAVQKKFTLLTLSVVSRFLAYLKS